MFQAQHESEILTFPLWFWNQLPPLPLSNRITPHLTLQLHKESYTCTPPNPALHACPCYLLPRDEHDKLGEQPLGEASAFS